MDNCTISPKGEQAGVGAILTETSKVRGENVVKYLPSIKCYHIVAAFGKRDVGGTTCNSVSCFVWQQP